MGKYSLLIISLLTAKIGLAEIHVNPKTYAKTFLKPSIERNERVLATITAAYKIAQPAPSKAEQMGIFSNALPIRRLHEAGYVASQKVRLYRDDSGTFARVSRQGGNVLLISELDLTDGTNLRVTSDEDRKILGYGRILIGFQPGYSSFMPIESGLKVCSGVVVGAEFEILTCLSHTSTPGISILSVTIPTTDLMSKARIHTVRLGDLTLAKSSTNQAEISEIKEHIENLGARQFSLRDKASQALLRVGPKAYPWVSKATESDDPEVAQRAEILVHEYQKTWKKQQIEETYTIVFSPNTTNKH